MKDATGQSVDAERPYLLLLLGALGLFGCVSMIAGTIAAQIVVPGHDWIADTISDLGAGRYEFIVDIGIYAFSAALIACALLCAHVHFGDGWWSTGTIGLALLGLIVFLVGARNEYGDRVLPGCLYDRQPDLQRTDRVCRRWLARGCRRQNPDAGAGVGDAERGGSHVQRAHHHCR